MGTEIERKFLVTGDGWRPAADAGRRLRQAYLAETGQSAVRVRIEDEARGWLTIKSASSGMSRLEFEYPVPVADAKELFELCETSILDKMRYAVPHAGRVWEVDVYAGANTGLTLAEVELESEHDAIDLPPWTGAEVTADRRYYAASLARRPFGKWANET